MSLAILKTVTTSFMVTALGGWCRLCCICCTYNIQANIGFPICMSSFMRTRFSWRAGNAQFLAQTYTRIWSDTRKCIFGGNAYSSFLRYNFAIFNNLHIGFNSTTLPLSAIQLHLGAEAETNHNIGYIHIV